ncbi:O-antigen ligase [Bradyrhizobium sp. JR7.2]|uniref:O-antigen ligase family protein n=1 Tax=Bradyrhizobium barranii TaxID=2992140 RepID=A0ABY3QU33_9BRAD|nr:MULTISPECIES: O-antigen ligase family protein [Bradyrhizobium]UFW89508.1 O-antigen ligase family protein [Bradyrhizobium japonicum]WFT98267.1 O-antigen ligase family protein [Bradyrhizobium barranii]
MNLPASFVDRSTTNPGKHRLTAGAAAIFRARSVSTIAVIGTFWAWCGLLSFPMIDLNPDFADVPTSFALGGTVLIGQITGIALFITTVSLMHASRAFASLGRLSLAQVAIIGIIYLSVVLQLHDDEAATFVGVFYTILLMLTALMLSVVWTLPPDDIETCMKVASIIFCLFGISALAVLGLPQGRNVGGIQPNLFSAPLLAGFILSQFHAGKTGIVVRILCFSMAALVSSRYALIGCISALVVHDLTFNSLRPWKVAAAIVALLLCIFLWPQIATFLALDDSSRDLSSGFTGRDEYWYAALATIMDHPLGIGFKRASAFEAGHNGYLKTLVEFGIVGGGLIILFVGCVIAAARAEAVRSTGKDRQQRRFACARLGGLVALAFGAFFQPQLFSLGDAFGVSLLLLLFKPEMKPVSGRAAIA